MTLNRPLTLDVAHLSTAWHGPDTVYFTDRDNFLIRKLVPNGDGTWVVVPWGLAVERCSGLVFVGDTGNSRIAVIGPVSAIWPTFAERLNTARVAEYRALMS